MSKMSELHLEIQEMCDRGMSAYTIAQILGISEDWVWDVICDMEKERDGLYDPPDPYDSWLSDGGA